MHIETLEDSIQNIWWLVLSLPVTHSVYLPYVGSHPVSLLLVEGQVLSAFSLRAWLVLLCQLHCMVPDTYPVLKGYSIDHVMLILWPIFAFAFMLTMFLWCCFLFRDCGGSGKRKSGEDLLYSMFILFTPYWTNILRSLYSSFMIFTELHGCSDVTHIHLCVCFGKNYCTCEMVLWIQRELCSIWHFKAKSNLQLCLRLWNQRIWRLKKNPYILVS